MLRLIELGKRFGETVVVDHLSLTVARGERMVLLGGSGSGKTTTLKMVNRLIEPDEGRVEIDGTDAATLAPHELRRRIGYCFQQVGLFPHLTVGENVAITPRLLGWADDRIAARVDELLTLVELDPGVVSRADAVVALRRTAATRRRRARARRASRTSCSSTSRSARSIR